MRVEVTIYRNFPYRARLSFPGVMRFWYCPLQASTEPCILGDVPSPSNVAISYLLYFGFFRFFYIFWIMQFWDNELHTSYTICKKIKSVEKYNTGLLCQIAACIYNYNCYGSTRYSLTNEKRSV